MTALDVGCGVGGPARAIASHSGGNVVGITINKYQVKKANDYAKAMNLSEQVEVGKCARAAWRCWALTRYLSARQLP